MDFVLYEQLGITALTASEKYSHFSKQEFDMVLDQAVKFAQNDLAPTNVEGDRIGAQWKEGKVSLPPSFHGPLQKYAEQGWVASVEEPEVGGQGLPLTLFTAAYEAFVAGNMAMSQYMTLTHGTALLVKLFGTQEQKSLYLEKLLGFEWGGTMCLTEPGAGSDLARIITRAEKIDDRYYRITGQKCFITAGDHDGKPNIIHAVLARVDGDPEGIKGISLFIVPKHRVNNDGSLEKSNDVSCSGIEHKMGIRGAATCSLVFGDLGDCIGELIGERCKGIQAMFYMMNEERLIVAMQAQGLAGTAYLNARDYAKERIQGTDITRKGAAAKSVSIIDHPDIRRSLLWMKAYVEGLRALNYYTAFCIDKRNSTADEQEQKILYGLIEFLTPVCKSYTSDMGFQVCNAAIQVFGGYGYCQDYPVEQFTRDCRITGIYEGTNGIQAIDLLSRKIPMSKGEVMKYLIAQIDKTIETADGMPALKKSSSAVKTARTQMLDAVSHLTSGIQAGRVHDAFMSATPLMEIVGDTLLGWMHLWQAIIAHERLHKIFQEKGAENNEQRRSLVATDREAAFYSGKIHTAQFFISRVLPVIKGKVMALSDDDFSLADVDEACFG
jgi:alkylation response protein AidB-like acyl-CoA dehydrogenase